MYRSASKQYSVNQYSTIDRGKLLMMMFDGALNFLRHSVEGHAKGNKAQFSRFLSKAQAVIAELNNTLDFEKGGEVAQQLERLYDFMLHHLTHANLEKSGDKVEDVIRVLSPIVEAYRTILSRGDINFDDLEAQAIALKNAGAPSDPSVLPGAPATPSNPASEEGKDHSPTPRVRISL